MSFFTIAVILFVVLFGGFMALQYFGVIPTAKPVVAAIIVLAYFVGILVAAKFTGHL